MVKRKKKKNMFFDKTKQKIKIKVQSIQEKITKIKMVVKSGIKKRNIFKNNDLELNSFMFLSLDF